MMVRRAYGDDAAVLHTREVVPGPLTRWLKGRVIEVVARPMTQQMEVQDHAPSVVSEHAEHDSPASRVTARLDALQTMIDGLESTNQGTADRVLQDARDAMVRDGLEPEEADRLIGRARRELPREAQAEPILLEEFLSAERSTSAPRESHGNKQPALTP